jgi:hypothetical protein
MLKLDRNATGYRLPGLPGLPGLLGTGSSLATEGCRLLPDRYRGCITGAYRVKKGSESLGERKGSESLGES